jgi:hypothetical protein
LKYPARLNIMRFKIIELSTTFNVQVIELADERAP